MIGGHVENVDMQYLKERDQQKLLELQEDLLENAQKRKVRLYFV